jgi:hypothetical protein
VGIFVLWTIKSYEGPGLAQIPESVQVLFGILMSGKVVQKFEEKKAGRATATVGTTQGAGVTPATGDA